MSKRHWTTVFQQNVGKRRSKTYDLIMRVAEYQSFIALIQEPWIVKTSFPDIGSSYCKLLIPLRTTDCWPYQHWYAQHGSNDVNLSLLGPKPAEPDSKVYQLHLGVRGKLNSLPNWWGLNCSLSTLERQTG